MNRSHNHHGCDHYLVHLGYCPQKEYIHFGEQLQLIAVNNLTYCLLFSDCRFNRDDISLSDFFHALNAIIFGSGKFLSKISSVFSILNN
jgi:hypothetical protein